VGEGMRKAQMGCKPAVEDENMEEQWKGNWNLL
jgi:hypothetical protein